MKAEVAFAKIIPLRMLIGVPKKRQWQLEVYSFTPSIWLALDECVWILHSGRRLGRPTRPDHLEQGMEKWDM